MEGDRPLVVVDEQVVAVASRADQVRQVAHTVGDDRGAHAHRLQRHQAEGLLVAGDDHDGRSGEPGQHLVPGQRTTQVDARCAGRRLEAAVEEFGLRALVGLEPGLGEGHFDRPVPPGGGLQQVGPSRARVMANGVRRGSHRFRPAAESTAG